MPVRMALFFKASAGGKPFGSGTSTEWSALPVGLFNREQSFHSYSLAPALTRSVTNDALDPVRQDRHVKGLRHHLHPRMLSTR